MNENILAIKKVAKENLRTDIHFLFSKLNVEEKIQNKNKVFIKPNIFCPEPSNTGATVDLDVLAGVIDFFVERGKQVKVGEAGANQYDHEKLFRQLGLYEFCAKHEAEFINLNSCKFGEEEFNIKGKSRKFLVPIPVLTADFFVNVPKYKTHSSTRVSLAMKNLYGLLPDKEKWTGHALGLNETLVELNRVVRSDLVLTDSIVAMQGFGPTMGVPVVKNLLMASNNAVIHDFGLCQLQNIRGVSHIEQAVRGLPPEIAYYFYDIDQSPISHAEIDLFLKLMPALFSRVWYKVNEKLYAAGPSMERCFVSPKRILHLSVNETTIAFFRRLQGGNDIGESRTA